MFVPLLLLWHHHTFFHVGKEIPWRPDNKGLNFQGTVSVSPLDLFDTLFHQTHIHWIQINSPPSKEIFWKDCLWLALMKYTLENLHFNHIWSSAFQKWFCLTTSDLSFREVSFRRMPAFKSQVNRAQTNFPGGRNKPAQHLTGSRWALRCTGCICLLSARGGDAACLYDIASSQQSHRDSSKYHHCILLVGKTLA